MTQQEFASIASYIRTAYPNSNFLETKEVINTWFNDIKDLDGIVCMEAMREYVRNNEFPPSIAGIRKSCTKKINALADNWDIAWDKVMIAVRKYGTYGAKEAIDSFDELTRKSVKAIGFYEICTSSNTNFLRKEFREIYSQNKEDFDYNTQANDGIIGIEGRKGAQRYIE